MRLEIELPEAAPPALMSLEIELEDKAAAAPTVMRLEIELANDTADDATINDCAWHSVPGAFLLAFPLVNTSVNVSRVGSVEARMMPLADDDGWFGDFG